MKKFLILLVLICAGCTPKDELVVNCNIEGKKAVFVLSEGMIEKYTLNGTSISKSQIDEINGTYFTSSTNNSVGKTVLDDYVSSINGYCN